MTWASFSSLFMEKYIPRTLRDRKKDEFLSLEQGRMLVNAYEARFCALSRYATREDSPVCEGVEIRVADFGLTGSGYSKILPRSGRLRDRGGRSETR